MNQQGYTCSNCGYANPPGVDLCQHCGQSLSARRSTTGSNTRSTSISASPFKKLQAGLMRLWGRLTGRHTSTNKQPFSVGTLPFTAHSQQPAVSQSPSVSLTPPRVIHSVVSQTPSAPPAPQQAHVTPSPRGAGSPRQPSRPLPTNSLFKDERYLIVTPRQLDHTIYYDAVDLICPSCQTAYSQLPPKGFCSTCHQPLKTVLIHEHYQPVQHNMQPQVLQLNGAGHPQIFHHLDLIFFTKATFTILDHPRHWGVLVRGRHARSQDDALAITVQVARAFTFLHQRGFAYTQNTPASWHLALENILVLPGNDAKIADLSTIHPLPTNGKARQQVIGIDIAFLGYLLLYLNDDSIEFPGSPEQAPAPLHPVVERALQRQYASAAAFIQDIRGLGSVAGRRALKPLHGQATHPGQRHQRNEDAIVTFTYDKQQEGQSVPIGFYLVADGMGGHEAGNIASRTVNDIVTDWVLQSKVLPDLRKTTRKLSKESITEELLQDAVQQANQALHRRAQTQGSDLGSTVTAALIIGNTVTVVSVGDSRTYMLREGRLQQVTQDHSLVARLVEANVIAPQELRQHPRRNEIYRSLGQDEAVEVDTFIFPLKRMDRLILCCDGLWEMIDDKEIQRIIEASKSPQQACDALINAANRAGGEDNISVIVVAME